MEIIGLIPDTSVLVYYIYGNNEQKKNIKVNFKKHDNRIIINSILISEVGRVIFKPFFQLKLEIERYISNNSDLNTDDLWIDLVQKISRTRSNQLIRRCFTIITNLRNIINKVSLNKSDSYYFEKEADRIKVAINFFIENVLLEFQEELIKWELKSTYYCPQSEWSIVYNDELYNYEYKYNEHCVYLCHNREEKLLNLTERYKNEFLEILKKGRQFCKDLKVEPDKRLLVTIDKLINIYLGKKKFDFRTKYCHNLGDFLIAILLINSDDILYTYNIKDFKLIFKFLSINQEKILPF